MLMLCSSGCKIEDNKLLTKTRTSLVIFTSWVSADCKYLNKQVCLMRHDCFSHCWSNYFVPIEKKLMWFSLSQSCILSRGISLSRFSTWVLSDKINCACHDYIKPTVWCRVHHLFSSSYSANSIFKLNTDTFALECIGFRSVVCVIHANVICTFIACSLMWNFLHCCLGQDSLVKRFLINNGNITG